MTQHGLSFDIEDWVQLAARRVDGMTAEPSADVDDCIARILDLCDELDLKATFFVMGLLAAARPHAVRRIAERGHEVASHSFHHRLLYTLSRDELAADLRDSKAQLEDLAGAPVVGFRAPEFSVRTLDAPIFEVLSELGFEYDSSVFPVEGLRYGVRAPHAPFMIGDLVELPLATTEVAGRRVPIAGGSGFRLLPKQFLRWATAGADQRGETLVFYFHPYEFTRQFLKLPGGLARNWKLAKHIALHNFRTGQVERSLRAVLGKLQFVPLRELARREKAA
jgi:polysaccharide deacetylase family protein (PEP-CTERM system associated)